MESSVNIWRYQKQSGVVIIVALVTLLVMTMVGLTAIGNATLQERMAANNRFYLQSRLNAETALREAEDYLSNRITGTPLILNTNNDVLTLITDNNHIYLNDANSLKAPTAQVDSPSSNFSLADKTSWAPGLNTQAVPVSNTDNDSEYIIEYIGISDYVTPKSVVDLSSSNDPSPRPSWTFRISAIGYSSNSNIYSVVESIFATEPR